jgi:ribulose 1,5-bisphosphate synthetase/thiazole synthase
MTEPLLPVKNRTESFWLSQRDPELCKARTTADLPRSADVVIVGSGLSGALTSYLLLEEAKAKGMKLNVVMLEADEACGSATARNGAYTRSLS